MGGTKSILKPEQLESANKIIVYGSDNCPYCVKVKSIFEDLQVAIDFRNIDNSKKDATDYAGLSNFLKYDTVPMVFIDKKFYGGCDSIKELLAKGELQQLIK